MRFLSLSTAVLSLALFTSVDAAVTKEKRGPGAVDEIAQARISRNQAKPRRRLSDLAKRNDGISVEAGAEIDWQWGWGSNNHHGNHPQPKPSKGHNKCPPEGQDCQWPGNPLAWLLPGEECFGDNYRSVHSACESPKKTCCPPGTSCQLDESCWLYKCM